MCPDDSAGSSGGSPRKSTGPLKAPFGSPESTGEADDSRGELFQWGRGDFTFRLAELIILLAAIVGAMALGLGISEYFAAHPYVLAYLVTYAAFRLADLLVRDQAVLGVDRIHLGRRVMYELPLLVLFFAAPFERSWYSGEAPRWLCALGLLLELVGFWLVLGARIQLWFFSSAPADGGGRMTLVRNGLYRHIRHPIYLGQFLVLFAWPFEYAAPITLASTALLGAVVMRRRMRDDEAEMLAEFGDEYAAYMQVTDSVMPNVW
jgi:protein-S-isoprenylcysteine O-methyltransferase Ste14